MYSSLEYIIHCEDRMCQHGTCVILSEENMFVTAVQLLYYCFTSLQALAEIFWLLLFTAVLLSALSYSFVCYSLVTVTNFGIDESY